MTAEKYLDWGRMLIGKIELLKEEEENLAIRATRGRSNFGMCLRRGGYSRDPMAEAVIRIQDAKERVAERRKQLEKELEEIKEVIRGVGDWEIEEVLTKWHLEGKGVEEIAAEMFLSESTVRRRQKEGLAAVERGMEKTVNQDTSRSADPEQSATGQRRNSATDFKPIRMG